MVAQMSSTEQAFTPNAYAACKNGRLMPCRLIAVGPDGFWADVVAPGGQEYSFPTDRLLSVEEAEAQIHKDRVAKVASSYAFEALRIDRSGMIVRCWNPAHPVRSNYVLTFSNGRETCSCPSYQKSCQQAGAAATCKHIVGYHLKQDQAAAPRPVAVQPVAAEDW